MTFIQVRVRCGLDQNGSKEVVGNFGCLLKVELIVLRKVALVASSFLKPQGHVSSPALKWGFKNKIETHWRATSSLSSAARLQNLL